MIKTVFFDVDGVLIDSFEANFTFYRDLMTFVGHQVPDREKYRPLFHRTMQQVIAHLAPEADENEREQIRRIALNREVRYPEELLLIPAGRDQIIESLSDQYELGIVTSRVAGRVFTLTQLASLEHFFKTTIYYEDTEKHKPDPEPLLLACERLKVQPDQSVYVGDAQTDIEAAKSAGMSAIAFTKNSIIGADRQTTDFNELPKLITTL
jgi:pyrophosphatase PpaX